MNIKQLQPFAIGILSGVSIAFIFNHIFKRRQTQQTQIKISKQFQKHQIQEYQQLKQEQLVRSIQYFGKHKYSQIQSSYITIFGAGSIGSHVINMIARSGIRKIRIIDFANIGIDHLLSHAYATRADVGASKVKCVATYIHKIFSHIQIQAFNQKVTANNIEKLISLDTNYVIDCLNDAKAKSLIISFCIKNNLKYIVSSSANQKNDFTRLQIKDIFDCRNDQLIINTRRQLIKIGIKKGVKGVFSYQQSDQQMMINKQKKPLFGGMPGLIGMTIVSYVLCDICQQKYEPYLTYDIKNPIFENIQSRLISDQKKMGVQNNNIEFDIEDIIFLMRYIFQDRCFITKKLTKQVFMTRWNPQLKGSINNLVLMSRQAYLQHIKYKNLNEMKYPQKIFEDFSNLQLKIKKIKNLEH